jgi:hypothetical protein
LLLQVLAVSTPATGQQTAAALHSAARLEVSLSNPADIAQVLQAVDGLQHRVGLMCFAVALWSAVKVAASPQQQQQQQQQMVPPDPLQQQQQVPPLTSQQQQQCMQLQQWLRSTTALLPSASTGELLMLLHACVLGKQTPSGEWWDVAAGRLQQLVPDMSSSNCVFLSQLLLLLLLLRQQQHQQQHVQAVPHQQQHQQQQSKRLMLLPPLPAGPKPQSQLARQQQQQQSSQPVTASQQASHLLGSAPAVAAAAGVVWEANVRALLVFLCRRVEQLEVQQRIAGSSLQNFERNMSRIKQLLKAGS